VESLLPVVFQMDNIILIHVRRDPLQNREAKISVIAVAKLAISAVTVDSIFLPSAVDVVLTVRGADVSFSVRSSKM
jgi:hypothetical protein